MSNSAFMIRYGLLSFLLDLVAIPIAAVVVPFAVLFARWDKEPTTWTGGASDNGPPTIRGDLPMWLSWFGTFDERLPGGMYEPTVRKVYNAVGRYWCSVYWLVVRNRMFGLRKALFTVEGGEPWRKERRFGPLRLEWGVKRYRATPQAHWLNGPFVLIADASLELARQEDV